jgi:signal transduction histidine kinase
MDDTAASFLRRRLAWVAGGRLLFLVGALVLVGGFYLRQDPSLDSYSVQLGLGVLGVSFALAAAYAVALRAKWNAELLAHTQLVLDQLTWTVLVYLTGGMASGATSFYGLSCLLGAILTGLRGAFVAAFSGAAAYVGLIYALHSGYLTPPRDQPASVYRVLPGETTYYLFVNLLVLIVVMLLAGYLAERLRITGGALARAEVRAIEAERMAALGRLAAGLAHEIRNPLGSIAGSVRLLKTAAGLGEEDRQLCGIVEREAARLNDLVTDMTDLAKPRPPNIVELDASATVREVVTLAGRSGRAATDVSVRFEGSDGLIIRADPGQYRQLVWNLVRNAVQASTAGDEVSVRLETDARGMVVLAVADRGVGIDQAARERLFDAFFTTRHKGTGIGLAVVKRIADDHGFRIVVESAAGRGATFKVFCGKARGKPLASVVAS